MYSMYLLSLAGWLERNMLPCVYKKYLGVECPGCGMQRALIELLKGNLLESIKVYPALLPTFFLIIYLSLHLIFKFEKGALVLKISFIFTASIIVMNFIIKLIFHI
ncbi:MAG: DUF2752 domain-containing protein [Bacteroidales bacterium]